jgi:hypothetical protein
MGTLDAGDLSSHPGLDIQRVICAFYGPITLSGLV